MFADLDRLSEDLDHRGVTSPGARSRFFFRKALEERRGDPAAWARLLLRKAADLVRPWPNPLFWPRSVVATVVVWTFGEMFFFPGMAAYLTDIAPPSHRGEYMGLSQMVMGLASWAEIVPSPR